MPCRCLYGIWILAWMAVSAGAQSPSEFEPIEGTPTDLQLGFPAPALSPMDQQFLMECVRQTLEDRLEGRAEAPSTFIPFELKGLRCRVSVTLRKRGRALASADSPYAPVVDACRSATLKAWQEVSEDRPADILELRELGVELELIGPRDRIGDGTDSHVAMAIHYIPAYHGIAVRRKDREWLARPSQLIARSSLCIDQLDIDHECNRYERTLLEFRKQLGLLREEVVEGAEDIAFLRFATQHLYQPDAAGDVIHLRGGMRTVIQEDMTAEELRASARRVARYVQYRQNQDGTFSYEFLPGRDMYWPVEQNWVRQAGTAWALAGYASGSKDPEASDTARRSLDALAKMIRPVKDVPHASYVHTPDDKHALGTTALTALAMMDAPNPKRYEDALMGLIQGMVWMQRDNGSFNTNFPPSLESSSQRYYPGETLLALARRYEQTGDGALRKVCDRALPFYQEYFRTRPDPSFVPWQTQAWAKLARKTQLERYAAFVFEMSDALVETQVLLEDTTASPRPLPIYDGAFDPENDGVMGIATGVYIEGLVEALRTAEAFKDAPRAGRYRHAVEKGIRFVVQLQFREEEGYYVRSPLDVYGGFRNTPINPTLRIDHCQHGLAALMGAADIWDRSVPREVKPRPQR